MCLRPGSFRLYGEGFLTAVRHLVLPCYGGCDAVAGGMSLPSRRMSHREVLPRGAFGGISPGGRILCFGLIFQA